MKLRILTAAALLSVLAFASPAGADVNLRLGLTDDPDTIFIGVGADIPLTGGRSGLLVIEPSGDLGLGEFGDRDFFTIRGSANFKYFIPVGRDAMAYPLGGVSIYYINVEDGGSDSDIGINLGGGIKFRQFGFELQLGVEDVPDLTFLFFFAI